MAEEIQRFRWIWGVSVLTEDVPMREKVGASNLSVKAILSDHCFGRICASSQSVRGDGGNACHWHAFEITSFRARNMSRLRDCPPFRYQTAADEDSCRMSNGTRHLYCPCCEFDCIVGRAAGVPQ